MHKHRTSYYVVSYVIGYFSLRESYKEDDSCTVFKSRERNIYTVKGLKGAIVYLGGILVIIGDIWWYRMVYL